MRRDRCPHCHRNGFHLWKLEKEVAAVLTCRYCGELALIFRGRVLPLDKRILESGTLEERKLHLAEVIGTLLESGLLDFSVLKADMHPMDAAEGKNISKEKLDKTSPTDSISDQEMERFVKIDLKRLDNPNYFKRIFG